MTGRTSPAMTIVLNGRYQLGRLAAEGGMAHVYAGHDLVLDREVAIKLLRAQYSNSPEFLGRFRREARHAASMAHPHLVNVYDVGEDAGRHYIVMELLPGRTLKDLVTDGPPPLDVAIVLSRQVALGIAYAHRRGLVHRDLKPQNVLLTEDHQAKVADFGLAQAQEANQLTAPGTVWGTVQYISPEQAQGLPADTRSDIYALGAVFYELVSGRPPYEAETPPAMMMKHVYDPVPRVRDVDPSILPAVDRVIARAMAKSPDDRFASMDEFAQALASLRDAASADTMVWGAIVGRDQRSGAAPIPGQAPTRGSRTAAEAGPAGPAAQALPAAHDRTQALVTPPPSPRVGRPPIRQPAVVTKPRRSRRPWLPVALAGASLAFFALMALGALLAQQMFGVPAPTPPRATQAPVFRETPTPALPPTPTTPVRVTVPGVIGEPLAKAQERLAGSNLVWELGEDFSRDVPAGSVAAQDPAPGAALESGKAVKLVVSRGPQRAAVPNVLGKSVTSATEELAKAGFTVKRADEFNTLAAAGAVFDQTPRGGEAEVGSDVTIRVSRGRDQVAVPQVISQSETAARERLTTAGFKVEAAFEPYSGVDPGVVFAQEPLADVLIDRGATVKIKVRRDSTPAPAPPSPTAVPPTTVPPTAIRAAPSPTTAPATAAATAPAGGGAPGATATPNRPGGTPSPGGQGTPRP